MSKVTLPRVNCLSVWDKNVANFKNKGFIEKKAV